MAGGIIDPYHRLETGLLDRVRVSTRVRGRMFKFQTLEVWKKAIEYCNKMIAISDSLPKQYQYTFSSQLTSAALSVPNNIAEGSGRKGTKEANNFYNISKGSTYETINILIILVKRNLYDKENFLIRYQEAEEICRMLTGLMRRK